MTTRRLSSYKSWILIEDSPFWRLKSVLMISRVAMFHKMLNFGSIRMKKMQLGQNYASNSFTHKTKCWNGTLKCKCYSPRLRMTLVFCNRLEFLSTNSELHSVSLQEKSKINKTIWEEQQRKKEKRRRKETTNMPHKRKEPPNNSMHTLINSLLSKGSILSRSHGLKWLVGSSTFS